MHKRLKRQKVEHARRRPDYLFLQVKTPHINSLYTKMMMNINVIQIY